MITTLTGKNEFMSAAELKRLETEFVKEHGDTTLIKLDGKEIEPHQLSEAVMSQPFLAGKSMVVLKGLAEAKNLHDTVVGIVEKTPDTTDLVIYEPNLDKRTNLYKILRNKTDFKDFSQLSDQELTDWVVKKFDRNIDRATARHLVLRAGEDQWRLNGEIEKLNNFEETIDRELIDSVVELHPRETIFELLDAIGAGQQGQALKLYSALTNNKADPTYILSMLIWQLHNMSVLVTAGRRSDNEIARDVGMSPYVVSKTRSTISNIDTKKLRYMWEEILEVDRKIKSSSVNNRQIVEQLIVKLSS